MNEIEKLVREELGKIVGKDINEIPDDTDLVESVGLDSLNILEVFGMMEDKFKVVVDSDKISNMKTIKDIVSIIEEGKNSQEEK